MKTPVTGPWVPAPGRATKGQKISWQVRQHYTLSILNVSVRKINFVSKSIEVDMSKTVLMWCSSTESGIQTMVPVLVVETELEDQDWDQNQVSSVGRYWNACCAYVEHRGHRTCRRYFISAVHGKLHTLIVLHVVWYYYFAYAGLNRSFFYQELFHFQTFILKISPWHVFCLLNASIFLCNGQ